MRRAVTKRPGQEPQSLRLLVSEASTDRSTHHSMHSGKWPGGQGTSVCAQTPKRLQKGPPHSMGLTAGAPSHQDWPGHCHCFKADLSVTETNVKPSIGQLPERGPSASHWQSDCRSPVCPREGSTRPTVVGNYSGCGCLSWHSTCASTTKGFHSVYCTASTPIEVAQNK